MLMEGYILGKFSKYMNNDGSLLPKDGPQYTKHVSAFTHYSYCITKGRYMISDHQGVANI